jgi:kynurenine formamidase
MKSDRKWDMGELIDLSAEIHHGMPSLPARISMCVQSATYLETGAHIFPEMEKINEVGLDRLFVSAVVLQIPCESGQKIYAVDIETQLTQSDETINPGDAVIISTGYDSFKKEADPSPNFSYDAVEYIVNHEPSILGSDMGAYHDGREKPSFFPMFLKSGTLLLAPMVNLTKITSSRINMIVMPLRIRGVCASPCRVIGVLPPESSIER